MAKEAVGQAMVAVVKAQGGAARALAVVKTVAAAMGSVVSEVGGKATGEKMVGRDIQVGAEG